MADLNELRLDGNLFELQTVADLVEKARSGAKLEYSDLNILHRWNTEELKKLNSVAKTYLASVAKALELNLSGDVSLPENLTKLRRALNGYPKDDAPMAALRLLENDGMLNSLISGRQTIIDASSFKQAALLQKVVETANETKKDVTTEVGSVKNSRTERVVSNKRKERAELKHSTDQKFEKNRRFLSDKAINDRFNQVLLTLSVKQESKIKALFEAAVIAQGMSLEKNKAQYSATMNVHAVAILQGLVNTDWKTERSKATKLIVDGELGEKTLVALETIIGSVDAVKEKTSPSAAITSSTETTSTPERTVVTNGNDVTITYRGGSSFKGTKTPGGAEWVGKIYGADGKSYGAAVDVKTLAVKIAE